MVSSMAKSQLVKSLCALLLCLLLSRTTLAQLFEPSNLQELPSDDDQIVDPNDVYMVENTDFLGSWRIHSENAGVSAMHMQLMPNNKAVWFDSTGNGLSEINHNPPFCKGRIGGRPTDPALDCTAHAIQYDVETAQIRTLKMQSSPWCSSGALAKNGDLISTGGDKDGFRAMRILQGCPNCDFMESNRGLFSSRWYASNHALENGSHIVVGGRFSFNYEIIPTDTFVFTPNLQELPLLLQTDDDGFRENNLYPFVNLLPDGNLFVFANHKSIILNPYTGQAVRQLPDFTNARNYPASASSALLPLDLNRVGEPEAEVIICGGNTREAYLLSDLQQPKRTFLPALKDCGRLNLNRPDAMWEMEEMPSPRVMSDMLILPTGDLLLINGAQAGTSAWNAAAEPNLTPVLYSPKSPKGSRFRVLAPTTIPRMYHSVSAVLPSGEILVAGSNTNAFYLLPKYKDNFIYPSELRVEKFTPPYLDPKLQGWRVNITDPQTIQLQYGQRFVLSVSAENGFLRRREVRVTMYSPPFTTHGYSMNQRLLILKMKRVKRYQILLEAPPSGRIAPPGYYLLFVVRRGVPSRGVWVQIG